MARVDISEQETVIQISRDEKVAKIWTSDLTMITKLKKYKPIKVEKSGKDIVAQWFEIPKELISFRLPSKPREKKDKKTLDK